MHRSRRHLQRIRGRLHDADDNRCCTLVHLQFYSFRVIFSVFSSYEIIVSNYSTLVAKTREATVPTATWGRLDTNIMKMWLCSVLKDENLDPLVELVIPLICIHSISLVGAIYFLASLPPSLPCLAASHAGHKLRIRVIWLKVFILFSGSKFMLSLLLVMRASR